MSLVIDDEEKIVFITQFGIFCDTKMAFGLKNGGATYQKCKGGSTRIASNKSFWKHN
jgi:hypothetical protein